ncbi:hypothetical protein AGIG_G15009 [Arapaima gigas]
MSHDNVPNPTLQLPSLSIAGSKVRLQSSAFISPEVSAAQLCSRPTEAHPRTSKCFMGPKKEALLYRRENIMTNTILGH